MLSTLRNSRRAATQAQKVTSRGFAKDVQTSHEARASMLAGCNKLADAVAVTLGPKVKHAQETLHKTR